MSFCMQLEKIGGGLLWEVFQSEGEGFVCLKRRKIKKRSVLENGGEHKLKTINADASHGRHKLNGPGGGRSYRKIKL